MKKILILIGALKTGGAEKITVDLIQYMDRSELDIYFLVSEDTGNYEQRVLDMGCKVVHVKERYHPYIRYFRMLNKIWDEYGPFDVVHSMSLLQNGISCFWACSKGVKKNICYSHSTNSHNPDKFVYRVYEMLMKRAIKKYATDYLACGEDAGKYLYGEEFFKEKGVLICNGVDFEKYRYRDDIRLELRKEYKVEDRYVIGHVARLTELKNQIFVLEVVYELKKMGVFCCYIIVGAGPMKAQIENKISKLGLEDDVIMLGDSTSVSELQNMFDIVIFPSWYEGVPLALVEAQANRIPCLISDTVSSEVKFAYKTQFFSLDKSAREWAEKARVLLENKREDNEFLPNSNRYDIKLSAESLHNVYCS